MIRKSSRTPYHAIAVKPRRARLLSRLPAAILLLSLGPFAEPGLATEPATPEAAAAADPLAAIDAEREAVRREIRALEAQLGEEGAAHASAEQLERLQTLERTYHRQREVLRSESELRQREQDAEQRLASGPSGQLAQEPPYLLALLDALADARDAQQERTRTIGAALEAAKQAQTAGDERLEQAERARRREAEAAARAKDEAEAARLGLAADHAELESRVARARRDLAELEVANLERKLAVQRHDDRLLEDTVQWVREHLALDPDATQATRDQLGDREFQAKRAREEAEREIATAERRLADAERRLESDPADPTREAEVEARRSELLLSQQRDELANATLTRVESQRVLEERRVLVLAGDAARPSLLDWQAQLEADRAETERSLRLLEVGRVELERELTHARQSAAGASAGARRWAKRRVEAIESILALRKEDETARRQLDVLARRVLAELAERTARASLGDRLGDLARAGSAVWQFELFAVDDRPITFGKIASGLLLFALGFVVARLASGLLGRLLVRRTSLATGAATAIQGLLFYVLLVLFFLVALRSVSIPLTAFTVLGGALAIGVGFGSQNIVNNFISGLILLAERPIKVGDVIEVDGKRGTVEWIGPRSTRVRTFDNIHIIVPNSAFLEKSVINWTLSDDDVRTSVDLGVAYGSPTREVQRLLQHAISEHGRILEHPEPIVLFRDFGDDALLFRAYFWIRSRDMAERLTIESDVRYRIDHLFREAGITIAFPQRDVHLDAERPLPVRVVSTEAEAPESR
jgi:small-conductance mechanosensitive channel